MYINMASPTDGFSPTTFVTATLHGRGSLHCGYCSTAFMTALRDYAPRARYTARRTRDTATEATASGLDAGLSQAHRRRSAC